MLDGGSARPQAVEMHPLGRSIAALVLMLIIGAVAPASAHSMRELESQLMDRERYVEMTNRQAPGFTLDNADGGAVSLDRSEEHTSELQSQAYLVCRLLLEKKNNKQH